MKKEEEKEMKDEGDKEKRRQRDSAERRATEGAVHEETGLDLEVQVHPNLGTVSEGSGMECPGSKVVRCNAKIA